MHFGLWKYTFLIMQKYGHDESDPYAGGMFAPHFVGERWYFTERSLRHSYSYDTLL